MARPLSPLVVRLAFWEAVVGGLSVTKAAAAAGVSRRTGYWWVHNHQVVLPSSIQDLTLARVGSLSVQEREDIAVLLALGRGVRGIAATLGRAPSTISREVARNLVEGEYRPSLAQRQAWGRAQRPRPSKLDGLALREQVKRMLNKRLSPEQVAGRLRLEYPDNPEMNVSHETIYQALYVQLPGPLRPRPRIIAGRTGHRAAIGTGRAPTAAGRPAPAKVPRHGDDLRPAA